MKHLYKFINSTCIPSAWFWTQHGSPIQYTHYLFDLVHCLCGNSTASFETLLLQVHSVKPHIIFKYADFTRASGGQTVLLKF